MIPTFERFVVGIAVMPLHDFPKLPSIDRFEEFPKDAIHVLHARPFSESRQPESIRFTLDLPGMRCGIVNHSRDSPARAGEGSGWGPVHKDRRSEDSGPPVSRETNYAVATEFSRRASRRRYAARMPSAAGVKPKSFEKPAR